MKIGTRFKNEPYLAFKKEDAVLDKNLNCYVTPVDKTIELWKGRSVAVSAIVAAVDGKDIYFLINQYVIVYSFHIVAIYLRKEMLNQSLNLLCFLKISEE